MKGTSGDRKRRDSHSRSTKKSGTPAYLTPAQRKRAKQHLALALIKFAPGRPDGKAYERHWTKMKGGGAWTSIGLGNRATPDTLGPILKGQTLYRFSIKSMVTVTRETLDPCDLLGRVIDPWPMARVMPAGDPEPGESLGSIEAGKLGKALIESLNERIANWDRQGFYYLVRDDAAGRWLLYYWEEDAGLLDADDYEWWDTAEQGQRTGWQRELSRGIQATLKPKTSRKSAKTGALSKSVSSGAKTASEAKSEDRTRRGDDETIIRWSSGGTVLWQRHNIPADAEIIVLTDAQLRDEAWVDALIEDEMAAENAAEAKKSASPARRRRQAITKSAPRKTRRKANA